jgi:hypothetical protein
LANHVCNQERQTDPGAVCFETFWDLQTHDPDVAAQLAQDAAVNIETTTAAYACVEVDAE